MNFRLDDQIIDCQNMLAIDEAMMTKQRRYKRRVLIKSDSEN